MESVLVVEDDTTLVHTIVINLTARGYATQGAGTVREALASLEWFRPGVVLLDIDLPDASGWDVLRSIRAERGGPVAVIVMSALRPNSRLIEEFGCFGMLEKPFPMESLLRRVADSIERLHEETFRQTRPLKETHD